MLNALLDTILYIYQAWDRNKRDTGLYSVEAVFIFCFYLSFFFLCLSICLPVRLSNLFFVFFFSFLNLVSLYLWMFFFVELIYLRTFNMFS